VDPTKLELKSAHDPPVKKWGRSEREAGPGAMKKWAPLNNGKSKAKQKEKRKAEGQTIKKEKKVKLLPQRNGVLGKEVQESVFPEGGAKNVSNELKEKRKAK